MGTVLGMEHRSYGCFPKCARTNCFLSPQVISSLVFVLLWFRQIPFILFLVLSSHATVVLIPSDFYRSLFVSLYHLFLCFYESMPAVIDCVWIIMLHCTHSLWWLTTMKKKLKVQCLNVRKLKHKANLCWHISSMIFI